MVFMEIVTVLIVICLVFLFQTFFRKKTSSENNKKEEEEEEVKKKKKIMIELSKWEYFTFQMDKLNKLCVINRDGKSFTYKQLLIDMKEFVEKYELDDPKYQHIALLAEPSYDYVVATLSIWNLEKMVIPLCPDYPPKRLCYYASDSDVQLILCQKKLNYLIEPLKDLLKGKRKGIQFRSFDSHEPKENLPDIEIKRTRECCKTSNSCKTSNNSLIMYTSGTTNDPKGVIHTFGSIEAQIKNLRKKWNINENDVILHVLVLHHIHGIVNALHTTLWCKGTVKFVKMNVKNPVDIWESFKDVSVFHAVPTIYYSLMDYYDTLPEDIQKKYSSYSKKLRLMVCGSASLPISVAKKWKKITGQVLLERYVGRQFDNLQIKILKEKPDDTEGMLLIRGNSLFKGYYKREAETKKSFIILDGQKWFITGDWVKIDKDGNIIICGRKNVDMIKSGGFLISSLDVRKVLLEYKDIKQASVLGIDDDGKWGQIICALLVVKDKENFDLEKLKKWLKNELEKSKMPRRFLLVDEIQKNHMGKVNKKELKHLFIK